ncbi:MAG: ATP-binding protein [Phycisphaerales bacterium]|nr:ATP-binding protein [Phycisphaerales bacterium]
MATEQVAVRLAEGPAVGLLGPRQCGKTTLARSLGGGGGGYFDLEQPDERLRLDIEWDRLIAGKKLIILDEAQTWPEVFPRLRGAIDRDRKKNGRFLILGSVSPALMKQVSESLAGRLAMVELTPFLATELTPKIRENLWFHGGYPDGGILDGHNFGRWQRDYLTLLTQRDLPQWGLPAKPQTTMRLLRMLAAVHGQHWNAHQLGQSLGLDGKTVNSYVDYLEGAFLIRRLQPYFANIGKRLVKSPKMYWRDTGLLHAILNIKDERTLLSQPWVGASWEGHVIEQILGTLTATGQPHEAYWFRTSDQYELDLVLELDGERWAIEIKLTSSPTPADMTRLNKAADLIKATRRVLVTRTAKVVEGANRVSCDLDWLLARLQGYH